MVELVDGRTLRCEPDGERTHDRCIAVCYLDGADIAAIMVRRGPATARGSAVVAIARRGERRRGQCPVLTVELRIKRTCQHVCH
jgi:endonuclease YncB( thermonuclease family)